MTNPSVILRRRSFAERGATRGAVASFIKSNQECQVSLAFSCVQRTCKYKLKTTTKRCFTLEIMMTFFELGVKA